MRHKKKIKSKDYENCLEAAQLENKINHLQKNIIDVDSLKEDHKEFITILKTQHRFGSEKHNALRKKLIRLFSVQMMIK